MPNYHLQIVKQVQSLLPEDEIVTTLSVSGAGTGTTEDDGQGLTAAIDTYFQALSDADVLSGWFTGEFQVFGYDLSDPSQDTLGSPLFVESGASITGLSDLSLPLECALCVSFIADDEGVVPAARRRGRIFEGPLALNTESGDQPPRPLDASCQDLVDAFAAMLVDFGALNFGLAVWSRMDDNLYFVDRVWVDNEFDTMRSRGLESTQRFIPSP